MSGHGIRASRHFKELSHRTEDGDSFWATSSRLARRVAHHVDRQVARVRLAAEDFAEFLIPEDNPTPRLAVSKPKYDRNYMMACQSGRVYAARNGELIFN